MLENPFVGTKTQMPLRVIFCYAAILVLIFCSWRRSWFIGACGAVMMMALVEHPEMPRTVLGIPGLSPWNILIFNVTLAWWNQRRLEGNEWDLPQGITKLLFLFIGVIFINFVRCLIDPTPYCAYNFAGIINEAFFNSLKFMLPFYLFFDGCRTPERSRAALLSILALYLLLALLVVKHMGLAGASAGADLNGRGAKLIHNATGYHRVDMAMMLAGASWGVLALYNIMGAWWQKLAVLGGFALITLAEALTGGRTGYVTWCVIGFALCVLRWRKLLLLAPVGIAIALALMPAVTQRLSMGFVKSGDRNIIVHNNEDQITSGRTQVWPFALQGISRSPIIGYGRFGFLRSGTATEYFKAGVEEWVDHPHCAYLEMLLDSGVVGLFLVLPIYLAMLFYSFKLFRDKTDALNSTIGALSVALFLALLIAGLGAQTLYPKEGVAGMWTAAGLMLRRLVDLRQAQEAEVTLDEMSDDLAAGTPESVPV
jgi:O-antigen ligase